LPPFETSLRGSVQPNQTLGARSSAKLKASVVKFGRSMPGCHWDMVAFQASSNAQKSNNRNRASLLVSDWSCHSPQRFRTQSCITRHGEALDLEQEVLSLRCHQKQQSQKKNAASILVHAATSSTDGAPPTCRQSRGLVRQKHSAFNPPFSCAEGTSPFEKPLNEAQKKAPPRRVRLSRFWLE